MSVDIGDRVILKMDYFSAKSGMIGTIIKIVPVNNVGIVFDIPFEGGHSLDDTCKIGYGYWVPIDFLKKLDCKNKIVITSDGKTTTAKLYEDNKVIDCEKARCSPEDAFDFTIGAKLAMERLLKSSTPKYKTGDKVKVRSDLKDKIYTSIYGRSIDVANEMLEKRGKPVTIKEVLGGGAYSIKEDNYIWIDTMFEGYYDEPKRKRKFKIGDKVIGNKKANERYVTTIKGWIGTVTDVRCGKYFCAKDEKGRQFEVNEDCFDLYKESQYYSGKVVCIEGYRNMTTKGKIYEFKNGQITYDDGSKSKQHVKNFDEVETRFISKFIEIEED